MQTIDCGTEVSSLLGSHTDYSCLLQQLKQLLVGLDLGSELLPDELTAPWKAEKWHFLLQANHPGAEGYFAVVLVCLLSWFVLHPSQQWQTEHFFLTNLAWAHQSMQPCLLSTIHLSHHIDYGSTTMRACTSTSTRISKVLPKFCNKRILVFLL